MDVLVHSLCILFVYLLILKESPKQNSNSCFIYKPSKVWRIYERVFHQRVFGLIQFLPNIQHHNIEPFIKRQLKIVFIFMKAMQPFDLLCGFMKITFTTRLTELNIQKQRKRQHVTMLCSESNMLPCYAVVTKNLTQTTIKNLNRFVCYQSRTNQPYSSKNVQE